MRNLPVEMIYQIFVYLPYEWIVGTGSLISKDYNVISTSEDLYYYLCRRLTESEEELQDIYQENESSWKKCHNILRSFEFDIESARKYHNYFETFGNRNRKVKRINPSGTNPSIITNRPFLHNGDIFEVRMIRSKQASWSSVGVCVEGSKLIEDFVGDFNGSVSVYGYGKESSMSVYKSYIGKTFKIKEAGGKKKTLGVGDVLRMEYKINKINQKSITLDIYNLQDKEEFRVTKTKEKKEIELKTTINNKKKIFKKRNIFVIECITTENIYPCVSLGYGKEFEIVNEIRQSEIIIEEEKKE